MWIHSPSVYLVGKSTVEDSGMSGFLETHGVGWESDSEEGAEVLSEVAGRVCYMSFARPRPGGNAAYLQHILESGHGSVLEHGVYNFTFAGVSRSLTHELVRHRAGFAYSQLSQRYVDSSSVKFVVPSIIEQDPELKAIFQVACRTSLDAYARLSEAISQKIQNGLVSGVSPSEDRTHARKVARQAARSVLPNATETKIFVSANCRAWRHFLEMRGSVHAEPEIRRLAAAVCIILKHECYSIFGDFEASIHADGEYVVQSKYRKV